MLLEPVRPNRVVRTVPMESNNSSRAQVKRLSQDELLNTLLLLGNIDAFVMSVTLYRRFIVFCYPFTASRFTVCPILLNTAVNIVS